MHETDPSPNTQGARGGFVALLLLVVLAGGGWLWWTMRSSRQELAKVQGTLQLQVLTSRLGVVALEVEYGNYGRAREVASSVFDGIQNYGIAHGSLPENYAEVLEARDDVIVALAREDPMIRDRLVGLFFRLQIPVDTRLDPAYIVPAADSGVGMEPPTRRVDTTAPALLPDSFQPPRESITVPMDTGSVPPDTMR